MPKYRVQYGNAVIADGFFFKRQDAPLVKGTTPLPNPSLTDSVATLRHIATLPGCSEIKEAVLSQLSSAKRHVFFANFLIEDEDVVEALLQAVRRLNGHVYVITTLKAEDFASTDRDDEEADFKRHMACVEELARGGIMVRARRDCHAKFMSVDDERAIVTSANAVPTCYGRTSRTREANAENGVLISVVTEVRRLANFFRAMWRDGSNYYVAPGKAVFKVRDLSSTVLPIRCREPQVPSDDGEVLWTAPNDPRLRDRIVRMADATRRSLRLASWVIKGMDQHPVGDALHRAAQRDDVSIRIVVRGMRREDHRQQCYLLQRRLGSRVRILGDYYNHSKAVVRDETEAMVLSANLDAQHGLDSGVEVGFHSSNSEFVSAVSGFLDLLEADCAFEFVADPKQAEVAARYGRQRPFLDLGQALRLKASRINPPIRRFLADLKQKLVCVADDAANGEEARGRGRPFMLITDSVALRCTMRDAGVAEIMNCELNPAPSTRNRFDFYLPAIDVTVEADV